MKNFLDRADILLDFSTVEGDRIIIVADFSIDDLNYISVDSTARFQTFFPYYLPSYRLNSTAIATPNGDILGVVLAETDVDEIRSRIAIVPTVGDAFGI